MEGSCFALDWPAADAAVSALMTALNFGSAVRSRRHEDREAQPGLGNTAEHRLVAQAMLKVKGVNFAKP